MYHNPPFTTKTNSLNNNQDALIFRVDPETLQDPMRFLNQRKIEPHVCMACAFYCFLYLFEIIYHEYLAIFLNVCSNCLCMIKWQNGKDSASASAAFSPCFHRDYASGFLGEPPHLSPPTGHVVHTGLIPHMHIAWHKGGPQGSPRQ